MDLAGIASAERGLGALWTQEGSEDLNANLVRFEAGEGVGIHANNELDVVFVGISGSGTVVVDGEEFALGPGQLVFVPKGCLRAPRRMLLGALWPIEPNIGHNGPISWNVVDAISLAVLAVPWIVVGFAVFRAAGRRTEQPSTVR